MPSQNGYFMSQSNSHLETKLFISLSFVEGTISYDLASLAMLDAKDLPSVEKMGEDIIREHQQALFQHWSDMETAVLPDDQVQHLIVGVSTSHCGQI